MREPPIDICPLMAAENLDALASKSQTFGLLDKKTAPSAANTESGKETPARFINNTKPTLILRDGGKEVKMNEKSDTIDMIVDMLQRANCQEVRLTYFFLQALLGEGDSV